MSILIFISDLHLNEQSPATLAALQKFLREETTEADAIYILGDLFEAWIGDDDDSQWAKEVADTLLDLQKQGKKVYFMHGNRDFLVGEQFAKQCGMQILPDPTVIDVDGEKILITHGDILCTDDEAYQKFRKLVHKGWLQNWFLKLPLAWRKKIANLLRVKSKSAGPRKTAEMMDVNESAVVEMMAMHNARVMVHGHTHKPASHTLKIGKRYVLGAWDGHCATLVYENGDFDLQFRA